MAYEKNGFMHNDLHTNNILVMTLDTPIWIEYRYKDKPLWVYTKHIMMIIDYGMSSVVINEVRVNPPSTILDYPEDDRLSDILKAYMGILSRYEILRHEYLMLLNIFSEAFDTDSIELTNDQIELYIINANHRSIPLRNNSGVKLYL